MHPVLQETLENFLTTTIVLTSTIVVLEVTSVTLAHYNKKGLLTPAKRATAAPPGEWEYNSGSG